MVMSDKSLLSIVEKVRKLMDAQHAEIELVLQELWSGYGQLLRVRLKGASVPSVIVKLINWQEVNEHPRGWNGDFSHRRKLRSYAIESHWYQHWQPGGDPQCYLPKCWAVESTEHRMMLLLEDLDAKDYTEVHTAIGWEQIKTCLRWLAYFHARFIQSSPDGLWDEGTYWHLATRPQELAALRDLPLKNAAKAIDHALKATPYLTIVHGDAKLANFCFSKDGLDVAAVDFQYVGGGCGMKDVAYFIGSCLSESECEEKEEQILDCYFGHLKAAIDYYQQSIDGVLLEESWRPMYRIAWADFHRFLKGWSPGHWKINRYSERIVSEVINNQLA